MTGDAPSVAGGFFAIWLVTMGGSRSSRNCTLYYADSLIISIPLVIGHAERISHDSDSKTTS
jgi:hypothetical protein